MLWALAAPPAPAGTPQSLSAACLQGKGADPAMTCALVPITGISGLGSREENND